MPAHVQPRSRGRPRGRPRGDSDCRERLIAAALPAFTRLGFDGAGLRAIAADAGCDVSMVAHHFGSKAGLWRAVADRVVDRHEAWLPVAESLVHAAMPLGERVSRLLESMMDNLAAVPAYVMFVTREIAEAGDRRDYLTDRLIRPGVEACTPLWREAIEAGMIRPLEPAILQIGLFGAFSMVLSSREVIGQLAGREFGLDELKRALCHGLLGEFVLRPTG